MTHQQLEQRHAQLDRAIAACALDTRKLLSHISALDLLVWSHVKCEEAKRKADWAALEQRQLDGETPS